MPDAVIYVRVSSDEQEREGFSLDAQKELLREYARRQGITLVREFIEVETAKRAGRPQFTEMVKFLRKQARGKDRDVCCRTILVEKTDRLYRNLLDYATLDELDVDIHLVKESDILSPDAHSSQKFMHGIKVLMARQYVDNLGEEAKKGMKQKAKQGIWPSKAPLGYRNVDAPDGKKIVITDPVNAPVVARMFEWYSTGRYSMDEIGRMALDEGLALTRESKDSSLRAVVQYMLKNPFYYGEFVWKDETYIGSHEPLVTHELWDKVQQVRADRRTTKRRKSKREFAFSQFIRCGHCGCLLVGELKKQRYVYYHCTYYKGKCPEPYVREEVLDEQFADHMRSLAFDDQTLSCIRNLLMRSQADEQHIREEAVNRLQNEYRLLQRRIDIMYADRLDGRVSVEFFDEKSEQYRAEQRRLKQTIDEHELANQSYMEEGIALLELASQAGKCFKDRSVTEKRRLLNLVLSNSTWANDELTVEFRQPFDTIALGVRQCATEKAAGVDSGDLRLKRLRE